MKKQLQHSSKSVYNLGYHLVWSPKYRKKILTGKIERTLKWILYKKAREIGIWIKDLEIMPDHVHIFIKSNPSLDISWIVKMLKGSSSYEIKKRFPWIKYNLWRRGYFCESVGHISEYTIRRYIQNQKSYSLKNESTVGLTGTYKLDRELQK